MNESLRWWADGESVVAGLVDRLTDDDLAADSALPGWSRGHVVAHLARNADALVNLLTWAGTGVETPMYPSAQVRDADIEASAARPRGEMRADYVAACGRLAQAIEAMPDEAWRAQVRDGRGNPVPASSVPQKRAQEMWLHGVDLRAGLSFSDIPGDLRVAVVEQALDLFTRRGQAPDVTILLTDVDWAWGIGGTRVEGTSAAVAAWLTRADTSNLTGHVPLPPIWL